MLCDPTTVARPYEVLPFSVGFAKRVLVLSRLEGIATHFIRASRICPGDGCPACLRGLPAKYQGYVAVSFERSIRLLRLTQAAAAAGEMDGCWIPGSVVKVRKDRERRPFVVEFEKEHVQFNRSQVISRVELLNVIARLHGLPLPEEFDNFSDLCRQISDHARSQLDLVLAGSID